MLFYSRLLHMRQSMKLPHFLQKMIPVCIYIFVVAALYGITLKLGFFSDDYHMLHVASEQSNIFSYFVENLEGTRIGSSYGPLFSLITDIEWRLFGLTAWPYHLVNLVVYILTAMALSQLVIAYTKNNTAGFLAGFIFLLIPSHVSAVTWVAVQPHLFATLCIVTGLLCFKKYLDTKNNIFAVIAVGISVISLFFKEIGIVFLIWWAIMYMMHTKNLSVKSKELKSIALPFVGAMIGIGIYLSLRAYTTGSATHSYSGESFFQLDLIAIYQTVILYLVGMFVSVSHRNMFAPFFQYLMVITFVSTLLIGGYFRKLRSYMSKRVMLAIYCLCVSFIPYLSVQYNPFTNEGDRYTYLPSVFFAWFLGMFLFDILTRINKKSFRLARISFDIVFVVFCAYCVQSSYVLVQDWVYADRVVKETISTFSSFDENNQYVLLGIPDTVNGAQIVRNGIKEMMQLHTGKTFDMVRIPLYTQLYRIDEATDTTAVRVSLSASSDALLLDAKNGEYIFTGFPYYEDSLYIAHMQNFQIFGNRGTGILLQKPSQNDASTYNNVKMVYYTNHKYKIVDLANFEPWN